MSELRYLPNGTTELQSIEIIKQSGKNIVVSEQQAKELLHSFNGSIISAVTFLNKYALVNPDTNILEESSFEQAKERWANTIAEVDKQWDNPKDTQYFRELYDYMCPAGRQMLALGNKYLPHLTVDNCFTTAIEEDSIKGIFDAGYRIAKTFSYGGGQGIDLSPLRPKNSKVSNSARFSTGAASFAGFFSYVSDIIGQHGRRGALLVSMLINHPDIIDFIQCKSKDINAIRYANISVKITNDFMKALQNNEDFTLSFETKHETISKKVKAQNLWNILIESAWKSAEPGILFWDTCKKFSPSEIYQELQIIGTNPCQPSWATVLTPKGISTIGQIQVGDSIWSGSQWTKITNKWSTGIKPVFQFNTSAGNFIGTEDHKVVSNGNKIPVNRTAIIDTSQGPIGECEGLDKQDIMDGLVLGDGSIHKASNNLVHLYIGQKDQDYFTSEIKDLIKKYRPGLKNTAYEIITTITYQELPRTFHRTIPTRFKNGSPQKIRGFLRGLFSANGSIAGGRVTLKTSSKQLSTEVQEMLSAIGILSYITVNKTKPVTFKNGTYQIKESYDINITRDKKIFSNLIGFIQNYKNEGLQNSYPKNIVPGKSCFEIKSKNFLGEEEVFDITVDCPEHTYWTGGLLVSNCAEQVLENNGNCNLSSLFLYKFVQDPFQKESSFNFNLFQEMVQRAVRHLDNVIEIGLQHKPLEEQKITGAKGRRIGLGFTGFADTLSALGLTYGSKKSIVFTNRLMKIKRDSEYLASINLAKERGAFPVCKKDLHYTQPFFTNFPEDIIEQGKKYGQRNVAISTVAPSGSVSVILNNCSSGIEPVFEREYTRYINLGGKRQPFQITHPSIIDFKYIVGREPTEEESNRLFPTAYVIKPKDRIDLQSTIQMYVDSAISNTINLSKETTKEEVSEIYKYAWEKGLKGCTVYRDECREGILVTSPSEQKKQQPDTIIHKFTAEGGDKFYVHISYKETGEPYQVFITNYQTTDQDKFTKIANDFKKMLLSKGIPVNFLKSGETTESKISQQLDRSTNSIGKVTRLLSLSLKIGYLNEALQVLHQHAFAGSLAIKLMKLLSNDSMKETCHDCGSSNLVKDGSCKKCRDCGASMCS